MEDVVLFIVTYCMFIISLVVNVLFFVKNKTLKEINKYYADMYAECAEILSDVIVKSDDFSKYLECDEMDKDGFEVKLIENEQKSA